jgi:putative FmdB family regulatory protein
MLWKDYRCKDCGETQENVPSRAEDTERECPCGGTAKIVLTPKFTKFKGGGWTTRKPVEAFEGESEYTDDWGKDE